MRKVGLIVNSFYFGSMVKQKQE